LVGDDPASQVYVNFKEKACIELGYQSTVTRMSGDTTQADLLEKINQLNNDSEVDGILVQLPLPSHIQEAAIIEAIYPDKDVDGFHPINTGRLLNGEPCLEPCTPKGIIKLVESTGVAIEGKHAVVIGRSNIVGKPIAMMLLARNATVTICHSRTQNLADICASADILVAAVGRAEMFDATYVKEGAVVIDVGTNRVGKKLKGDMQYNSASGKAGYITPVPGGVGPMTIAMLMQNTLEAAKQHAN
jgi:methylenetetrahydrofolate dehydrogenase (NADP+)/methenyltetrahydrofolate cyclohydrolase